MNHRAASSHVGSGIPVVRATSPGAEIRDEAERRAAQKALRHRFSPVNVPEPITPAMHDAHKASLDEPAVQHETPLKPLRRFHLSHGPRTSHSIYLTGIQKRKTSRKRHVATFVERSDSSRQGSELLGEIASQKSGLGGDEGMKNSLQCGGHGESSSSASKRTEKTGQSMYDHPSTWDLDSDNLANELAAFALEISQNEKGENARNNISDVNRVDIQDTTMSLDQDFIYDTYVRVPIGGRKGSDDKSMNDVGLIVIDDEDQEFWQTFVESDEDSGWDEEDQDSNGLCYVAENELLLTVQS